MYILSSASEYLLKTGFGGQEGFVATSTTTSSEKSPHPIWFLALYLSQYEEPFSIPVVIV